MVTSLLLPNLRPRTMANDSYYRAAAGRSPNSRNLNPQAAGRFDQWQDRWRGIQHFARLRNIILPSCGRGTGGCSGKRCQ